MLLIDIEELMMMLAGEDSWYVENNYEATLENLYYILYEYDGLDRLIEYDEEPQSEYLS